MFRLQRAVFVVAYRSALSKGWWALDGLREQDRLHRTAISACSLRPDVVGTAHCEEVSVIPAMLKWHGDLLALTDTGLLAEKAS